MTTKELQELWSIRKTKIWVVDLNDKKQKKDTKIVRAKTNEGALITAKNNSIYFSNKKCFGNARLADPVSNLHCIAIKKEITKLDISNLNEKGLKEYKALLSSKLYNSIK